MGDLVDDTLVVPVAVRADDCVSDDDALTVNNRLPVLVDVGDALIMTDTDTVAVWVRVGDVDPVALAEPVPVMV